MQQLLNPIAIYNLLPRMKIWAGLFLLGLITGIMAHNLITPFMCPFYQTICKVAEDKGLADMGVMSSTILIFAKNAFVALLCILTARLTFGLYPGIIVVFNGMLIGYIGSMAVINSVMTVSQLLGGLVPHGIFELSGIFLACAIGFLKIPMKDKLRCSAIVWPLLLVAALTETTLSAFIIAY